MNLRYSLGIILPLVLILVLVVLSASETGYIVEIETVESLKFDDLYTDYRTNDNIVIQTITITNDYFLPRVYGLPRISVCLNDKDGKELSRYMFAKFNEGSYSESDVPIFNEEFGDFRPYSKHSVELPAHSKKQVKIAVEAEYLYNYNRTAKTYREFDELLLVEYSGGTSYIACVNLDDEEIESAVHISIN